MKLIGVLLLVLMMILTSTSCGPFSDPYVKGARDHYDNELDSELDDIIRGIQRIDTMNNIEFFSLYSDQFSSINIDLYGSDRIEDIISIGRYLNNYLEDSINSRIINDKVKVCIHLFKDEPERKTHEKLWYFASLANYNQINNTSDSEWNREFKFLDINVSDDLKTSSFNSCDIPFEVIWLPTNTIFDDYDVFINMKSLRKLVFDDPVLYENRVNSDNKKEEIKYYDKITDLHFKCYVE